MLINLHCCHWTWRRWRHSAAPLIILPTLEQHAHIRRTVTNSLLSVSIAVKLQSFVSFRQIDGVLSKQMCPGWIIIALTESLSQQLRQLHLHTLCSPVKHARTRSWTRQLGHTRPHEASTTARVQVGPSSTDKPHRATKNVWKFAEERCETHLALPPEKTERKKSSTYSSIPWINWGVT